MGTLAVVERILREKAKPLSVKEIVKFAGVELPTRSRTPDTVVSRDLSMDIKKHGDSSKFVRTSPGRYTLRALVTSAHDSKEGADSNSVHCKEKQGQSANGQSASASCNGPNSVESIVSKSLAGNPIGVIASKSNGNMSIEKTPEHTNLEPDAQANLLKAK